MRVVMWSYWRFDFEDSRDLHIVVSHLQRQFPSAPIAAVAWSAGAYPLARYLQKAGENTPLVAAVCQSGVLDFPQAVADVFSQQNPTYKQFLLFQERVCVRRHLDNDKNLSSAARDEIEAALREESDALRLYDRFLCAVHPPRTPPFIGAPPAAAAQAPRINPYGHECALDDTAADWQGRVQSASHYCAKAIDNMDRIAVTTLLLHAEDDPVVSSEHVDWRKVGRNRHIVVGHTKRGGHCSWYEGLTPWGGTWGDRVATNFISSVLESHSRTSFFLELIRQSMSQLSIGVSGAGLGGGMSGPASQRSSMSSVTTDSESQPMSMQTMKRICSASDLVLHRTPPLAVKTHGRGAGGAPIISWEQ